jgi:hypothetical protein
MSKRLQVQLDDNELSEIRNAARQQRMTTAEWVRQALRIARRATPEGDSRKKLDVIRAAARHSYPAPEIEQMLSEIEQGYLGNASR